MLRVVQAEGDGATRGRAIGSELGDLVHRSLGFYRDYLADLGIRDLAAAIAPYRVAAERSLPEHMETIAAMAAAAEVSEDELFAVNACEELEVLPRPAGRSPVERCSTFTAVGPGFAILAHNEQWFAGDADNVALIVERPSEAVAVASPTPAACLPAVGMNGLGGAQGIDSLTAHDDGVGVPRVLVSRHGLEAGGRPDAIRRVGLPGRAGGYAHVYAFRGGGRFSGDNSTRVGGAPRLGPAHQSLPRPQGVRARPPADRGELFALRAPAPAARGTPADQS